MVRALESKACKACSAAKRKCGKQTPHCLRCRTRSIKCTYPASKPSNFVLLREDSPPPPQSSFLPDNTPQLSQSIHSPTIYTGGLSLALALSPDFISNQQASNWFSSLETWQIRFPPLDQNQPLSIPDLKRFIRKIQQWLAEWTEKGSNPFIHARLYRNQSPRCISDAYLTLSCYLHKTVLNEDTVFQIIGDRAQGLVSEYSTNTPSDPLEHMARVHALLVYQAIGLYDGDIRLRYISESHIPVLHKWQRELVLQASHSVVSSALSSDLWYSWILSESIRRTYVVGSGLQWVFQAMKEGRAVPCQGGMMFTTRQGAWEAESAVEWEKLCSEVHVGLMQMAEAGSLFEKVAPHEVNRFTKVLLEFAFGMEKMERWGAKIEL